MAYDFNEIVSNFNVNGKLLSCERYGEGLINETYLAIIEQDGKPVNFILQKINNKLFKNVDKLMNNIRLVTEFNRKKIIERGGNPERESLTLIYTKDGKPYVENADGFFRMYVFITDAFAPEKVEKPEDFYYSGLAFGNFAKLLSEFDATQLYEVLPNFHNTKVRYENLVKAIDADIIGRKKDVQAEIDFYLSRKDYCGKIVDLLESGKMPTKVTHNDTKLNNIMIDNETGKPICVIDLDTIMPGSICYDFGDSIRSGCNTSTEDDPNLDNVNFDIDLFETYAKGYIEALGDGVTDIEKQHLPFGAMLMTFECGMRFLTDYLQGDTYFRTKRPNHNLDRTRTQMKLVSQMENLMDKLIAIVNKY